MLYLYTLLFDIMMLSLILNVSSKNHFKGKVFKDPYKIKRLAQFKNNLCKEVDGLLGKDESQLLSEIKKGVCLNEFDGEYEHNITKISQFDDEDQVASHPILLYKLVKQMHWFYNEVYLLKLQSVASNTGRENHVISRIQPLIQENLVFPTADDVSGVTLSLIVIALTYRLHPIELVEGKFGKHDIVGNRLSFEDIKDIYAECLRTKSSFFNSGQIGREQEDDVKETIHYAVAIEWMEAAEELLVKKLNEQWQDELSHAQDNENLMLKLDNVQKELQKLKRLHDENYEMMSNPVYTQNLTQPEDFFIRKFDDNPNITSIQLRMEEEDLESKLFSLRDHENEHRIQNFTRFRDYLTLCRGGTLKFRNDQSSKAVHTEEKCFLTHQDDPFLFLMPLKLEVIMKKPLSLYVFHSVLNSQQINEIQEYIDIMDTPFYEPSLESASFWTGTWNYEQIWLEDHYALPIYKTSHLLDKLTKLQVTSPELSGRESAIPLSLDQESNLSLASDYLMAGTYTPSGFYYPHFDEADGTVESRPHKRIATAIIYLSDVEGGATVFPNIGRTVFPSKGSVLFWHNLHSDGVRNEYTLHGGCPVLYGIKTIGNKWIHYGAQIFKKPCTENDRKIKS